MVILSHRGYWNTPSEKNTAIAFQRSFDLNFGAEVDVRDYRGKLVISHDMADENSLPLSDLLHLLAGRDLPLAINIKADGIALPLSRAMNEAQVKNWFAFDMSIPDARSYIQARCPIYARLSEVETEPVWPKTISGIWLDAFESTWYTEETIQHCMAQNLRVCVVSAELHGRDYHSLWNMLYSLAHNPLLSLCTDYPEEAHRFFRV